MASTALMVESGLVPFESLKKRTPFEIRHPLDTVLNPWKVRRASAITAGAIPE